MSFLSLPGFVIYGVRIIFISVIIGINALFYIHEFNGKRAVCIAFRYKLTLIICVIATSADITMYMRFNVMNTVIDISFMAVIMIRR